MWQKHSTFLERRDISMQKNILFLLLGFFIFITGQASALAESPPEEDRLPGLKIGTAAPDFSLKDLNGNIVKLSDYKGKKVMLNFWATWCPPCKAEMPAMEKFHGEVGEDVTILAVNIDARYDVKSYVEKMGVSFPVLLDEKDKVNNDYQILTIPTTFFIDKEGVIRHKYLSAMPIEIMREYSRDL